MASVFSVQHQCNHCSELLSDLQTPRLLPCSHSFCNKCLTSSFLHSNGVKCPDCGICWDFDSVEKIPDPHMCNFCEEQHIATHQCADCFEYLCETMAPFHTKTSHTKNHKVKLLSEVSEGPVGLNADQFVCPIHQRKFELFDKTCQTILCSLCALRSHKDHDLIFFEDPDLPKIIDSLAENLSSAETRISELDRVESQISSQLSSLDTSKDKSQTSLRTTFQILIDTLIARQLELENKLQELYKSKKFVLTDQLDRVRLLRDNLRISLSQTQALQPASPSSKTKRLSSSTSTSISSSSLDSKSNSVITQPKKTSKNNKKKKQKPDPEVVDLAVDDVEAENDEPQATTTTTTSSSSPITTTSSSIPIDSSVDNTTTAPTVPTAPTPSSTSSNKFIQYTQSLSSLLQFLSSTNPNVFPMYPLENSSLLFSLSLNPGEDWSSTQDPDLEESFKKIFKKTIQGISSLGDLVSLRIGSAAHSTASGMGLSALVIGKPMTIQLHIRDVLGSEIKPEEGDSLGSWSIEIGKTRRIVSIQQSTNKNNKQTQTFYFQYTLRESDYITLTTTTPTTSSFSSSSSSFSSSSITTRKSTSTSTSTSSSTLTYSSFTPTTTTRTPTTTTTTTTTTHNRLSLSILCNGTHIIDSPFFPQLSQFGWEQPQFMKTISYNHYQCPISMVVIQNYLIVNHLDSTCTYSSLPDSTSINQFNYYNDPQSFNCYYYYHNFAVLGTKYNTQSTTPLNLYTSTPGTTNLESGLLNSNPTPTYKRMYSIPMSAKPIGVIESDSICYVLTQNSISVYHISSLLTSSTNILTTTAPGPLPTPLPPPPIALYTFGKFKSAICFQFMKEEDLLIVCDCDAHRISIFSLENRTLIKVLGTTTKGSSINQFSSPSGLAIINDELFISDTYNHRIQIYSLKTFEYLRSFGSLGSGDESFNYPKGLCYHENRLYVADSGNKRIQQFTFSS